MDSEPRTVRTVDETEARDPVRFTYARLRIAGLTAREASTLAGRLEGLPWVPGGWSIDEVERLLFTSELVRSGRMGS